MANQTRILTPQEIAYYAYKAGFRGQALNTAVAIALAESGGNPVAYNPETAAGTKAGSGSRGLWQIYGTAHPWANNPQVFDPQANANAAFRVFREAGNSFRPWSTYNQGLANPKYDFSKMIFGNQKAPSLQSPVSQVITSGTFNTPFQGATLNGQTVQTDEGSFLNKTPLGIFFGGEDNKGRTLGDFGMFVSGSALIIIGLIMLFVIGTSKAVESDPKLLAEAAKLAAGV